MVFLFLISALIVLIFFYLFSVKGRVGYADWSRFEGYLYAHRGLHSKNTAPENSLAAFKNALESGYGIEFDVHLLADGGLAVVHDYSLKRISGKDVNVESLKTDDLCKFNLFESRETVPTLIEVLNLIKGTVPIIIELKSTKENFAQLCLNTAEILQNYKGAYCIESFDPRCIYWFKKNKPDVIRGQLCENFLKSKENKFPLPAKAIISAMPTNFLTKPDFIAYRFSDISHPSFKICSSLWKMQTVCWTVTNEEDTKKALNSGIFVIFEGFKP